jgi:cytoskeletal protein RodZ
LATVLFQRVKPPLAQTGSEAEIPPSAGLRSAGEALRQQREALGLELGQVAAELRIKPGYLDAIEEGRVDRLPGAAYAVGFVRAYSTYLGLDSAEILRRFRVAAAALSTKPDLSFPLPLGERSRPGGGTLALAVVLAICGYGAWYFLSAGERAMPERIAEVPAALLPPPPKPQPPAVAQPAAAATAPTTATAPTKPRVPTNPAVPTNPSSPGPRRSAPTVATSGRLPADGTAAGRSGSASPPATSAAPVAVSHPASAAPAPAPVGAAIPVNLAPASVPAKSSPGDAMASPSPSPTSPPPPLPQDATPRLYGAETGPSRIVIRAHADSWIQVRGADRSVVFAGLLKPGDSYRVPDRPGLSMRAGNAGGLDVTVDGNPAPALGPIGSVRNVALDPKSLAPSTARN